MQLSNEQALNNILFGLYFGFPHCCIVDFNLHMVDGRMHECKDDLPFAGTGYIPCPKCRKKGVMEIHINIAKNRQHVEPFPLDKGVDYYIANKITAGVFTDVSLVLELHSKVLNAISDFNPHK